jgi:hypothetical protein
MVTPTAARQVRTTTRNCHVQSDLTKVSPDSDVASTRKAEWIRDFQAGA